MSLETILAALGIAAFVIDLAINLVQMVRNALSQRPTMHTVAA